MDEDRKMVTSAAEQRRSRWTDQLPAGDQGDAGSECITNYLQQPGGSEPGCNTIEQNNGEKNSLKIIRH